VKISLPCGMANDSPVLSRPERQQAHHDACGLVGCECQCGHPNGQQIPGQRNPGRTMADRPSNA
jgi:hypothetical protein